MIKGFRAIEIAGHDVEMIERFDGHALLLDAAISFVPNRVVHKYARRTAFRGALDLAMRENCLPYIQNFL
jgi:hypothetical protein